MAVKDVTEIADHAGDAVDRLPQRYKDPAKTWTGFWAGNPQATAWETVIRAFSGPAQEIESIMQSMLSGRTLSGSTGVNLDRIGQIVGEERQGRVDDDYRTAIYAQIAENNSDTTARDLLNIVALFVDDELDNVKIGETFPAAIRVYVYVTGTVLDPQALTDSLSSAKAAGVKLEVIRVPPADYFGFDSDPSATGFATIAGGGGGSYATMYEGE